MIDRALAFTAAAVLSASGVIAAPISALSELTYTHDFRITDLPTSIFLSPMSPRQTERNAAVDLDRGGAVLTDAPFEQARDTDAADPVPFIDQRTLGERTADDAHSATAAYDVEILTVEQPGGLIDGVAQRVVDNSGQAALSSVDGAQDADASSDYDYRRTFIITRNTINTPPEPFFIAGVFDADIAATFDGANGFARTSLFYELELVGEAADVLFSPAAPYLTEIEDSGPNATVSESLSIGLDGFQLSVAASAFGGGDPAEARYSGQFGYLFSVTLQPGASLIVTERFAQTNAAVYRADEIPPIPLPASLPLLAAAFGVLALFRKGGRP
ncbi:hypothetical protein [Rubrimonas cliftonensis]|uniref:VPLPA-CTERM protein sorting domain-containing protein n=1 Tax=Rubrimonas cliftonensis TaxID=89524 RepID=A0A1H4GFZ3_9RHOB|nr:hypothetical protein [Rubrimonas cliftonensis]SEB07642.1 VPLPA-CTERM protein sorting domain-containing protein [Rubrimonas cliftonensis]